jgi:hypothetical protein
MTCSVRAGGSRRTQSILFPSRSMSGSRPKSLFKEAAQGIRLGCDRWFCPMLAKMAGEIWAVYHGPNKPKCRMECWYRSGICSAQRPTNSSIEHSINATSRRDIRIELRSKSVILPAQSLAPRNAREDHLPALRPCLPWERHLLSYSSPLHGPGFAER